MPNRTPLFGLRQPGGTINVISIDRHPGNVWFVDSNAGGGADSAGSGQSPTTPFLTLAYAFSSDLVASGDVVYLMPGHSETITAAAGIVCDIAGVTVIGLGAGTSRATISFTTATTADLDIDAANITFRNIRFVCGMAALAAPIDVNAAHFTMEDCDVFINAAANHPLLVVLTDAAANHITIRRCEFHLEYDTAATSLIITTARNAAVRVVGSDFARIEDCYIAGNFTVSAIDFVTTASRDVKILRNHIRNVQTTNIAGIIDLVAATTGVVAENQGFHGYTTDIATVIDPASCAMVQNYFSNVVTETGGLVGTAST